MDECHSKLYIYSTNTKKLNQMIRTLHRKVVLTVESSDTVHLGNSIGEYTAKGSSHGGGTEEQSVAKSLFATSVPERDQVD